MALPPVRFGVGWQMLFVPWGVSNGSRGMRDDVKARASRNITKGEPELDPDALPLFSRPPTQFLCVLCVGVRVLVRMFVSVFWQARVGA